MNGIIISNLIVLILPDVQLKIALNKFYTEKILTYT